MSQNNIQKAAKGSRDTMRALYDAHKSKVMCLCQALLLDENEADHATAYIYKKAFEELVTGRVTSDEEFQKLVIRKTILHCKSRAMKKSNRAFRVPASSNFAYSYDPLKMDFSGTPDEIILKNLPAFPRFIYVLYYVADYSEAEIARTFNTTPKVIGNALEAETTNVERIAAAASKSGVSSPKLSAEKFHARLMKDADSAKVPTSVDATVRMSIDDICEPIQKKEKQKRTGILAGVMALLVVVGIVIGVTAGSGENSDVDLDNADLDATISTGVDENADDTSETDETGDTTADIEIKATYYADIEMENYGTITVALDGNTAPETVANFVSLAQSGFYDGLTFHRIMDGFMMQGGCPEGTGSGGNSDADGNEINITGEFSANGFDNPLSHTAGAISMARADDYNSASSQFFIVHTSDYTSSLDGLYACFGYVTEGMDIVDAICKAADPNAENGMIAAEDQPVITSITIREVEQSDETEQSGDDGVADGTDASSIDAADGTHTVEDESSDPDSVDSEGNTDSVDSSDATA